MAAELGQVEEIFHLALNVAPEARAAYLNTLCQDEDLREEIDSLITAYESSGRLFEENTVPLAMRLLGSTPDDSMAGQNIGPYHILSTLGQGGMGSVYLADDSRLDRKVALKFISGEFVTDNWAKRQLTKEAQAVAKLDHPNICAVYGYDEIDGHSFIVMQYIEGQTLAELIRADSIGDDQIVPLAQQIVGALGAAHAHGIIHRDIKPKNIMVTPAGQVKVLDFGLAKTIPKALEDATESISQLSRDGLLVGTVAYMSPEQLRGDRVDFRSDIFSFGTVLYEIACGKNPYAHKATADVISAIMSTEPDPLRQVTSDCPRDLERIVKRCMKKDRNDRYQSAAELSIDLDNLHKGIALPRPASSFFDVRFAALAAAVLLLIVAGISAYKSWAGSEQILAVWPIECEGPDLKDKCPGPAMTENLVRALQRRQGLRVVSARAVPTLYGPQAASPQKAGRDLNADTVFSGRIIRGENGLVLTSRLQRVHDGSRIAEYSYQLNTEKISQVEQQLSIETAYYLQLPMNEDDRNLFAAMAAQQNRNPEAMTLYLTGRSFWSKRDGQNIRKAIENFKEATEKDPLFALAWAGLADCYVLMDSPAYGEMASKDAIVKAEFAARQALKIDDKLAEAHNANATVLMRGHWDWENAEKEFKRAIELNPDCSPAHLGYSSLLSYSGRSLEALKESELARNLDPFSPAAIMNDCRTKYFDHQFDQANACLEQLAVENPNYAGGKYLRGIVYIELGRIAEATKIFEEIYARDKLYGGAMLGFSYGMANRREDALRILAEMRELQKDHYVPSQELGIIYLGLNEMDLALPLLRKSVEEKFAPSQALSSAPMFDRYRSDPRFNELAKLIRPPAHPSPAPSASGTATR